MKVGDRIEVLEYELKGMQGNVISIYKDVVVTVQLDNMNVPAATIKDNLKVIAEAK